MSLVHRVTACVFLVVLAIGATVALVANPHRMPQASDSTLPGHDETPQAKPLDHVFRVIASPACDESIDQACDDAEQLIRNAADPRTIPRREDYISDFIAVLRLCDQQDRFEDDHGQLNEDLIAAEDPPRLRIAFFTAERVIRVLGDFQADEAIEDIGEFLRIRSDDVRKTPAGWIDNGTGSPKIGDVPSHWVLFVIGDAALPTLRRKMTSDEVHVRDHAQRVAVELLGPRSSRVLHEWVDAATTDDERQLLVEATTMFENVTRGTKGTKKESPEFYRSELLNRGRQRLASRLKNREETERRNEEMQRFNALGLKEQLEYLRQKAVIATESEISEIAERLAERGDFSLVPAIGERVRGAIGVAVPPFRYVTFLCRRGEAEDLRFLRQAARDDLNSGATLGSSRIFGAVSAGVQVCNNPYAVPILVDFLGQRQLTGIRARVGNEKGVPCSCADSCMGALIRLTGHNEGYVWDAPPQEREAAFDRWIEWWNREGQAAYVERYPDLAKVLEP